MLKKKKMQISLKNLGNKNHIQKTVVSNKINCYTGEHMSNSNLVTVIQIKILVSTDLSSCPKMDLWQSP